MQHSECLVFFNPITVYLFASFFYFTPGSAMSLSYFFYMLVWAGDYFVCFLSQTRTWFSFAPCENMPMQYTGIFKGVKNEKFQYRLFFFFSFIAIFLSFAKNRLWAEAILTSTHNLCFATKIRKTGIPMQIPVFLYRSGV